MANKQKRLVWTGANRQAAQLDGWDIFEWDDPKMFLINPLDDPHGVAKEFYGVEYKGKNFHNGRNEELLEKHLRAKLKAGDPLVVKALEILRRRKSPQIHRLVPKPLEGNQRRHPYP